MSLAELVATRRLLSGRFLPGLPVNASGFSLSPVPHHSPCAKFKKPSTIDTSIG